MTSPTLPPSPPHDGRSLSPADSPSADRSASVARSEATSASTSADPLQPCQWQSCDKSFVDAETLYNHLCNDHIGRKSTNNLCLTCKWKDCQTSCAKRDHITSHLRVHTPLKPHICEICKKSFKRPQDLKKHEKIHTEEHHAQHKHSKAITVADPVYVSRVRGYEPTRPMPPVQQMKTKMPGGPMSHRMAGVRHHRASLSQENFDSRSFGTLPTPSPEINPASVSGLDDGLIDMPTWDAIRSDGSYAAVTGAKRSHDYVVDDFFTDVKKRRVNPAYDPRMADRLNSMAYARQMAIRNGQSFNPTSISLDIRNEEELAAVNQFLLTLGRDVTSGPTAPTSRHHYSQSADYPSSAGHGFSSQDYFDANTLRELGLSGMPGLGESTLSHDFMPSYPVPPARSSHYNMYPTLDDVRASVASQHHPYGAQAMSQSYSHGSSYHTPPLELSGGGSPHSHSSISTPPASTPPSLPQTHVALAGTGMYAGAGISPESAAVFDHLRPSRGPAHVPHLSPMDFGGKTMRTIVPLQSVPTQAPEPVEPKLPRKIHRGPPARLTPLADSSSSERLYPLLTSGDAELKLAPLQSRYRSPSPLLSAASPPSSDSGSSSSSSATTPPASPLLTQKAIGRSDETQRLARAVNGIHITGEQRREHAELIRDLLVAINREFQERAREESPRPRSRMRLEESTRDVEMTAA